MLKKIKSSIISISISVVCGFLFGRLVYNIYEDKNTKVFSDNKIYLIQSGSFSSYENMRMETMAYDYVFFEDKGKFNSIIGITKDKDNIEKIVSLYDFDTDIVEFYLMDEEINNKIREYDNLLKNETDRDKIMDITNNMLTFYKDKNVVLSKNY